MQPPIQYRFKPTDTVYFMVDNKISSGIVSLITIVVTELTTTVQYSVQLKSCRTITKSDRLCYASIEDLIMNLKEQSDHEGI